MNNRKNIFLLLKIISTTILFACGILAKPTSAAQVTITAEYRPTNQDPNIISFKNTTPCSLPGATQKWCEKTDGQIPVAIKLLSPIKRFFTDSEDPMDGVYLRTPSERRIMLTNDLGEQQELVFRITDIGYQTSVQSGESSLHSLTASSLTTPGVGSQCDSGGRALTGTSTDTYFFWGVKAENTGSGATCFSRMKSGVAQDIDIEQLFVGYSLQTALPSSFRSGVYRGSLNLTIGQAGDIGLGNSPMTDFLTLNFEIVVQHAFKVQFPPDSERVVLAPVGGWQPWFNSGRTPPALKRDIPFYLTTSGPITIRLSCQHYSGGPTSQCLLKKNDTEEFVPLMVRVSLPGLRGARGERVENFTLSRINISRFITYAYSHEQRSLLHFEVESESVNEMVKQAGSQWEGSVTLMFDADITQYF